MLLLQMSQSYQSKTPTTVSLMPLLFLLSPRTIPDVKLHIAVGTETAIARAKVPDPEYALIVLLVVYPVPLILACTLY